MPNEKVNQPVVSAIRYVQLSHFCQQRAVPDRVEGFTVGYCNNNNIRVINQQVRDFVKDCYRPNSGGGRSSRPEGKLIVKSEVCWRLLYSSGPSSHYSHGSESLREFARFT